MRQLLLLMGARARMVRRSAQEFVRGSRLRAAVVTTLAVLFWVFMLFLFHDLFDYLEENFPVVSSRILNYLLAFLFASLLVMMTLSDAIIAYTSLYRSDETDFLFALPTAPPNTFAYRGADSVVFSVWAVFTLVLPLAIAYGLVFPVPWYYYPFAVALATLLVCLATELGAFFALVVGALMPRDSRKALIAVCAALIGLAVLWFAPLSGQLENQPLGEGAIRSVMRRIAFCQHWALPSHWVSRGMMAAAQGEIREATYLGALLLSNVLFLGVVVYRLAFYIYRPGWLRARAASSRKRWRWSGLAADLVGKAAFFLPLRLRCLILKDLKTFLRDPAQWSQFLLFFGLLGLYILNLPRFNLEALAGQWHSLIALMNLGATSLTLATLTTRFVFPQLSLEGRRIWLLGLLPLNRRSLLWAKFVFVVLGTYAVSGGLIALSDAILRLPLWVMAVHLGVVFCVCCGLNGLALGLGACFPRPDTDNPAKVVSSFGGTLNLICSIGFITAALGPVVVPLHLYMVGRSASAALPWAIAAGLAVAFLLSAAATLLPMLAGARALEKMEF